MIIEIEWDHYKDLSVPFRELSVAKDISFFAQLDIKSKSALQFVEALFGRISSLDIPQDLNTAFEKRDLGKESKTVHGKETEAIIGLLCENGGEKGERLRSRLQKRLEDSSQNLDTVLNQGLKEESSVEKDLFSYDVGSYYIEEVQIATYVTTKAVEVFEEFKEFPEHQQLCTNAFTSTPAQAFEKENGTSQAFIVTEMKMLEVYLRQLNIPPGMEEQAGLQIYVPLLEIQSIFRTTAPPDGRKDTSSQLRKYGSSTSSKPNPYPHHSWQSDPNSYTLPISHAPDKTTSGTEQAATFAAPTVDAVQCTSGHQGAEHVSGLLSIKSSSDTWPSSYNQCTTAVTESEDAGVVLVSEASSSDTNSHLIVVADYTPSNTSKLLESSDEVSEPLKSFSTSSSTDASVDSEFLHANGDELKARGGGDGIHYNSQESDDKYPSFSLVPRPPHSGEIEEPLPLENSGDPKTNQQLVEMKANRGKETREPLTAAERGCFTDVSTVSCCTKSKPKAVLGPDMDFPNSSLIHCALLLSQMDYLSPDIGTVLCETNGAKTAPKRSSLSSKLPLVAGGMDPNILVEALKVHPSEPPASCWPIKATEIDQSGASTHNTRSSQVLSKSLAMQPSLKQGCTSIPEHFPLCGPQLINLLTSTSDHFSYSILCDLAAHCLPVRAVPNEVNLWGQLCTPVYSPMAMEITEASSVSMPAKFTEVAIQQLPHMYSCSDSTRNSPSDEATCELQASLKQKLQEYPWPGCTSSTEQLHHIPHAYRPPLVNVLTSAKVGHLWTSTFTALCDLAAHSENTVNLQSQLCDPVSPNAMDCTMDCTPNAMDCTPINCTDLTSCSEVRVDRSDMPCHSLRPTPTTTRSTLMVPTATSSGSPTSYYHGCVPEVESRPQLRDIKRSIPIQEEIKPKLKKTRMSMPTPVREIKGKHKLRKAKRSMPTPLRQAMETRKTKRSLPSPLRLTIEAKQVLRKMKRTLPTPIREAIKQWPTLRTMKRHHIPITKTRRSMPTPVQKAVEGKPALRKTMPTHGRKEIGDRPQLRKTKSPMSTPVKLKLKKTKMPMPTPVRKEIEGKHRLRKTKRSMPTPLRQAIKTKRALRKTKRSLPSPLRLTIEAKQVLRKMKRTLPTPIREAIKQWPTLRTMKRHHIPITKTKRSMPTPVRKVIEGKPTSRKTEHSMPTPVRKEIKDRPQLKKTRMSMPTPVREIKGKHKLRKAKRSMPTPLRQAIKTRKTKRSLPSPLRLTIEAKQVLRKMKRTLPTPIREAIKQWPTLRTMKRHHIPITKTKRSMPTPVRNAVEGKPALRKTMPTHGRKEIGDRPQLRKTKSPMSTPVKLKLKKTKMPMPTPVRKEIEGKHRLRKTKRSMPTPLRQAIKTKRALRKTKRSLPSPLRLTIEAKQVLRKMKRTLPTPIREAIKQWPTLRTMKRHHIPITKTKRSMPTPVRKVIEGKPTSRKTEHSMPTPVRKEIKDRPQLKKTRMSMPTPVREIKGKHKLRKAKRSMPTPLRQAIKTRKTKHSLPSPLRLTIEAKQVLRKMKRILPTPICEAIKQWPTLRTMKRCHIPITKRPVDDESSNEGSSSNTGSSDSSGSSSGSESASGGDFPQDGGEGSSGGCGASGSGQGDDDDDDKKPPKKGPIPSKESPRQKKKRRKKKRRKVSGPESDSEDCHSPANQEHPASDDGSFKEHSHPTNTQKRKQQAPELPFSAAVSNKVDSSNTSLSSSSGSCSIDKRRRGRDCDHTPSRSGQDDVPLQEEPPSRERRKRKKVRNKGLGSPVPKPRTRDSSPNYHNRIRHDGEKPIQAKKEHSYSPTRKQHPPTRKQHPKTSPPVSIVLIPLVLSFIRPDSTAHGQDPPEGSPAGSSQRKDAGPHSTSVVQTDTAPIEGQPPSQTPPSPSHQHAPDRQQGLQPEGPSNPDSGAVHAHAGVPESAEDTITSSPSLPTPSAEATGPPEFSSGPGDVQQKWKRKPEPRKVSSSSLDFAVLPMHESCSETQSEYDYGISEPSNEVPDCSHLEEQLEVLQNPAEFSAGLEDEHESLHQHFNGHAPGYPPLLQHFNKCTSDSNCSDGDCTEPCPMPPQQCTYPTDGGHQVLPSPGPGCQQVQSSYETDGHHNYNATSLPNQSQFSDPYGHTAMCVGGEVFTSPPEAGSSDNPSQHHFHTWYQPFSNYCELHVPVTSPPPSQREV